MKKIKIYPSLISGNLLHLADQIDLLEPHCDGFHVDVMDNHFVPNLTWGPAMVNAIASYSDKITYVHLMTEKVDELISRLKLKEGNIVAFHFESDIKVLGAIDLLRERKLVPSLAISPKTPIKEILGVLDMFDQILLMSVNPGFSGQHFLPDSLDRLDELVAYRKKHNLNFEVGMDGGINITNIGNCVKHGATNFGIASGIFSYADPVSALKQLYQAAAAADAR